MPGLDPGIQPPDRRVEPGDDGWWKRGRERRFQSCIDNLAPLSSARKSQGTPPPVTMHSDQTYAYFAPAALLPSGWARDVRLEVTADGDLLAAEAGATPGSATRLAGPVVPGMPNLHSHAFQRAMAGLAEVAGPGEDSFWTWREVMYGFVGKLSPEQVEAIVEIDQRPGGGLRARVSVVLQSYPDRNIRSMLNGSATVMGATGTQAQQQAIEGAIRGALRNLPQAMAAAAASAQAASPSRRGRRGRR
mgnify:CR=1 FL=1